LSRQLPPPALSEASLSPGLYLVATPIGNLRDITLRALDVLAGCDVLLAEDTRVTGKLLSAYGIRTRLERHDEHVAERAIPGILERLEAGGRIALVSDAGTPMVSDPGSRLAREAIAAGHPVIPIPGASAALAALTLAGLPTERFLFAGFPPPKSAARRTFLEEFTNIRATLIFYEGASRVASSLTDMAAVFGPRPAAVCRELTKLYETCVRGSLDQLAADPRFESPKGEIVILVGPGEAKAASAQDVQAALQEAMTRLPLGEAASEVAKAFGLSRKDLYRQALKLREATE